MRRAIRLTLAVMVLAAVGAAGYVAYRLQHLETIKLDDHFYIVRGGGGNSSVLIGADGVLVVNTKLLGPGRHLAGIIRSLTDKPVKVIINTSYDADDTHGNINYPRSIDVIAQRHTRAHMIERDKQFWEVEPAWDMLPNDLVDDEKDLHFGGETLRIIHPGRGHTDGDLVVYFTTRHLLQTGGLFLRDVYPVIDLRAGGSARQWPATLGRMLALDGVTWYLPGYGPLSTRVDVVAFQGYLSSLESQVSRQVAAKRSLSATEGAVQLEGDEDLCSIPFLTSRARNIRAAYKELTSDR